MKIAIVGAGKLGIRVAEALLGGDYSVTVIDQDDDVLQKLASQLDIMTVNANAKEIKILKNLGISSYDYLLATTDSDEMNILIASFAKKLGCPKVIARVRDPEHMDQLGFIKETMGIDTIVNPDLAITVEIYKYLVEKYTLSNGIFSSGKISLIEFPASKLPKLIGMQITNVSSILGEKLVVAISRYGKIIIPRGGDIIQEDDGLYVVGERSPILSLNSIVHEKGKYTDLQKVMIVGGGKTGYYLARKLSEFGIAVKVIEVSKERCHYLSTHLDDVMVLHGDATDPNLLEEENLDEMDAFVTATGYDEDNLLLALMAKRHHIEDVIAKISRESYSDLIESMGIDMALNPLDITTSSVLRFVQGSKRVISSVLIQGQAEITEIVATSHMKIMDLPLKDLALPAGIIVAAIHRGLDVIIPNGDTVIQEGDRVILFSLLTALPTLEKLMRPSGKFSFFKNR